MRFLRGLGKLFWRFMVIFSFIVNIILVVVLLVVVLLIFQIKNNIAQPLVTGLHSSFVGLDNATIDWTIPVRAEVPVTLDIPLQQNTIVTLTENVPLSVTATILRQGVDILGGPVTVLLTLPVDTQLPVALDLNVPVRDQTLDVSLDVRAVIPLQQTQLHDVADNLRLLFEPLAVGLTNLPNNFGEAIDLTGDVLSGDANLLAPNEYSTMPWPGYSITAGLNYPDLLVNALVPDANRPVQTGIVAIGGIPVLDEQLRPTVYNAGGPAAVNQQAIINMQNLGINPIFFNGQLSSTRPNNTLTETQAQTAQEGNPDEGIIPPATGGPDIPPPTPGDMGVVPTPDSTAHPPSGSSPGDEGIIATPAGGG